MAMVSHHKGKVSVCPQSASCSGGSRIFPGGAPTPKSAIIFQFFAENCMKMKEFGPPGGARVPGAPPWIRQCHGHWFTTRPCYSAVGTHPTGMLSCYLLCSPSVHASTNILTPFSFLFLHSVTKLFGLTNLACSH